VELNRGDRSTCTLVRTNDTGPQFASTKITSSQALSAGRCRFGRSASLSFPGSAVGLPSRRRSYRWPATPSYPAFRVKPFHLVVVDDEVEFKTVIKAAIVAAKFKLHPMIFHGALAL
jgi:hypothetical protein